MPPRHPRSLKTLHTRISALAVVLLVVAVTAGSALLYDTYRRVETAQAERVSFWLRSMLAEQGREARSTAEGRASGETGLRLLQQPNDLRLRHRFEGEHVTVLQRRGYAVLLLLDARTRPIFAWTLNGTPLPKEPLPDSLFAALDTTGTMGGFVRWGPDVYRIGAASLGEPGEAAHGYVIVGAPLTSAYLEQLHQAIALPMHMTLTSPSDAAPMQLAAADSFVVLEPLTDLLDRRIATVRAPVDRSSELRRLTWSFAILALVLVAGAGVAWSVWYYGRRLLLEPLDHMVRDVEAMRDAKAFTELSGRLPVLEWEVLRTAFNETARALSEFQRRYRDVFDRAVDPMFLVDPTTGRVVDANPATVALTGVAATDMIGQSLPAELMPQGSGQRALRWKRPDGATLTWGLAASEVRIEGSTWLLAAYRDLTGREALAHTQKMEAVGLLAGGIAHDFNNLLGAVLTGVTAARALAGPDAAVLPALDGIEHAGTRAAQLTRQLLDFSRHDPLRVAPVDVAAAVENVRSMCSRAFERRIAIDVVVDDALPRVLGDAGEVEQALLNLCINARDALPDGGEIVIEAKARTLDADAALDVRVPRPGAYVELSVADTGTGMTDEVKARLFEPFFTTKAPGKGTGLGLPIVHGLVRQLGGAITVESTVGAGTRVRLLIPALAEREARSAPVERRAETPRVPAYTAVPTERALVLVVDDEHTLREMMRIVLDLSGFDVVEAPDGTRALELVRLHQERLRAVLLDMQLPGARSGADTLAEIRALEPHLPVVLCTGFVRENDLARARLLGVEDILLKPLDLRVLVDRLRAVIAAASEG